ncbi:MAG: aldehyde dehydrogenase family protein [Bdellovibrionota bacterium]
MARRLGIYTLGHFMSLSGAQSYYLKKLWNPLLENYESWELSQLSTSTEDLKIIEQSLEGMSITHEQILGGFFPLSERVECLERVKVEFSKNFNNLAQILSMEVHKPLSLAKAECERCLLTLQGSIDLGRELLKDPPLMKATLGTQVNTQLSGESSPQPRRLIFGITPFNFPLNLSLHKIAPALLAGAPMIWRPSQKGQLSGLALIDILHAAKVPAGLIAYLPMTNECFWEVLKDSRIEAISFTGSAAVGWELQKKFRGPSILELGGSAPTYVENIKGDELRKALKSILASAYSFAGQSCISTQSVHIHEDIFEEAKKILIEETKSFKIGKTWDENTLCSSVIDEAAQERIEKSLKKAEKAGATLHRTVQLDIPNFVAPTLVEKANEELLTEEIFAPVLCLQKVKDFAEFQSFANKLSHRLQCAVFSQEESTLKKARLLDFGGVSLNATSSVRIDDLPYGGRGLAGLGAECPKTSWEFSAPYKTFYKPK